MTEEIKQEFIDYITRLPGVETDRLIHSLDTEPSVSIKLNRRKCTGLEETGYADMATPVKWCDSGFYLSERPLFTLNPLLHAGVFYVQDASSMIHETILGRLLPQLPAQPAVLDLCAAPGGKTTSLINALPDGSLVVANEFDSRRAKILRDNLLKWGYPGIIATNSPTDTFARVGERFDVVTVDAPCSGEGMMRKDPDARTQWSEALVAKCSALQKDIIGNAVAALRPGGFLIYSTCTFNTVENEDILRYAADTFGLGAVDLAIPAEWGILPAVAGDFPAMRFMPHATQGEGLFAAVLRKPDGDDLGDNPAKTAAAVRRQCRVILDGTPRTVKKGCDELPTSEWALSLDFPAGKYPEAELDTDTALRYLRREAITLPPGAAKGFTVVTYHGHRLGMVKNIGNRANNLYPLEWRIRMNVNN